MIPDHWKDSSTPGYLALVAAVILWTVGEIFVLPPTALGGVLLVTVLTGTLSLVGGLSCRRRDRHYRSTVGVLCLAAAVLFVATLWHRTDGAVPVTRHVSGSSTMPEQIRLVDFNVLHGYPRFRAQEERLGHLVEALRALDPTIVVLQEAWSVAGYGELATRLGEELGYDVAYSPANGSRRLIGFEEGSAVLSRLPIIDARRLVLEPRRVPWRSRIALVTTLELGPGERLTVAGTHLANGAPRVADAQSADLAARLPEADFLIVAGDFNAGSDSAALRVMEDRGLTQLAPGGIDHVLLRDAQQHWTVERASWTLRPADTADLIGETVTLSDHPGIVIDLVRHGRPPRDP